jgi:glyoxylase-like metal-dependent hydrolase (beta-lactamase superfamily II)
MDLSPAVRRLPFAIPEPAATVAVAPGVYWVRFSLPFKLDHVNVWLIEDGDAWTVIDTGLHDQRTRDSWMRLLTERLGGRPLRRVISTHFHPDHVGMAGWLGEQAGTALWMPEREWRMARLLTAPITDRDLAGFLDFYRHAGFPGELEGICRARIRHYAHCVSRIPDLAQPVDAGDVIEIGGREWQVWIGTGHSPQHAALYCPVMRVLISGDQVLPEISPNVSVVPRESERDPLGDFLDSLPKYLGLPEDTRVLPSHRWPFVGLHERVRMLLHHHDGRLAATLEACRQPRSGLAVLRVLFERELDDHQLFFAIGETLAHLHYLIHRGHVRRIERDDGVHLYERVA